MALKLCLMTGTFSLCLGAGLLPFTRSLSVNAKLASWTRCVAGGVMLAVGLVHLLSEGSKQLKEHGDWAFVLAGSSFLLMVLVLSVLSRELEDTRQLKVTKPSESTPLLAGSVMLLSLSLHSVNDRQVCMGLAFGVATTSAAVLSTGVAILGHKWADALALGLLLKRTRASFFVCLLHLLAFALVTPLAALLGVVLATTASAWVVGLTSSFAAGTLLYMAADLLREEFEEADLVKFCFYASGFFLFVGITLVLGYNCSCPAKSPNLTRLPLLNRAYSRSSASLSSASPSRSRPNAQSALDSSPSPSQSSCSNRQL